jgi:starch synthase
LKVLFAASESMPFVTTGGMGEVVGALPRALRQRFVGASVVMPLYSDIPESLRENLTFITSFNLTLSWRNQYCGVFQAKLGGVTYYLLDNEQYFKRQGLYGHYDDGERFAFFSKAALEFLQHIGFKPDVLHCNDWQSALVPVFYRAFYQDNPFYSGIKTVYTIHNLKYQGKYGWDLVGDLFGLGKEWNSTLEYDGCVNLMKAAVETADLVTTVSPTYAKEITEPYHGEGLDRIMRIHAGKLRGIINGIDTVNYDPEHDPMIFANYSTENMEPKGENKAGLQEMLRLEIDPEIPLLAMVTRLTDHKGIDLVIHVTEELINDGIQLVVLGTGDRNYEQFFQTIQARHPGQVHAAITFNHQLAHRIYAGADLFLMPSQSEPCGLSQMIALRYGTLPIVRETGGLRDTVRSYKEESGEGNGFSFKNYNADDMLYTIRRAVSFYKNSKVWEKLKRRAIEEDFSWKRSAGEYVRLYRELTGKR